MNRIAIIFFQASARQFFIIGISVLLIGIICTIGMSQYANALLDSITLEMKEMNGISISVSDALSNLKIGVITSYSLIAAGAAMIFIGVGRIRQTPKIIE